MLLLRIIYGYLGCSASHKVDMICTKHYNENGDDGSHPLGMGEERRYKEEENSWRVMGRKGDVDMGVKPDEIQGKSLC